ncbi:hypothetical protein JDV02_004657 [Purpureocillium takamizusanense]|uniref:Uncharacterized protein n=1 Tax=Purpureocillium takamizusanense TaxID=2060973 RepID=A0A9Q8QFR4_9HYPO|nr:uncharacterized protein JDV02_004657 [Purpureocillium takamizusanense]UNI18386.1 hypothetical protein JDV02_004657 [Purpureocillium takamizusanense]
MASARAKFPKDPFRIQTDLGEVLMLPPHLADEIRNAPQLNFTTAIVEDDHGTLRGFDFASMNTQTLIRNVAQRQLTKYLIIVTKPLSEETALAVSINFGDSIEWHEVMLKQAVNNVISRISSRVFLGDQICRNEQWLHLTELYSERFMHAGAQLRIWPRYLRPLVHWFLPECRRLRATQREAVRIIAPVVEARKKAKRDALAADEPVPVFNDALDWSEDEARVKRLSYDPAIVQLSLAIAAIHTTADLTEQFVLDIAQNPQYFAPLREEIIRCLREGGWKKSSLYNMKLLDSAIKESQRLKPSSIASMRRRVERQMILSNGIKLKAGDRIAVDSHRMWDPTLHEEPGRWDPYRFLSMRTADPAKENSAALLVTTSPDHLGFGHGRDACPGRFFAANEVKVALCHMIVKYEWELVPGTETKPNMMGLIAESSPTARITIRRRHNPELNIDSL